MSEYTFFSKDPAWWGEAFQSIWGCHDICPLLRSFHSTSITQLELSSLTILKAWGDPEKFKSKVAFLLILTGGCTEGDRVFGLYNVGAPIPSQGAHHGGGGQTVNPSILYLA